MLEMVHKRSLEAQQLHDLKYAQKRDYTKLVFDTSYQDILVGETINRCSYQAAYEFLGAKYQMVLPQVVNCERGEVLIDARGNGSYQQPRK
jgi:hypothetical protein